MLGFKLAKIRDSVFRLTVENDDLKNRVQLLLQKSQKNLVQLLLKKKSNM